MIKSLTDEELMTEAAKRNEVKKKKYAIWINV